MTENNTQPSKPDTDRIDVNDAAQVEHWAKKLDASTDQITDAVQAVGNSTADVEMHLKGTHATTNADREAQAEAASKSN